MKIEIPEHVQRWLWTAFAILFLAGSIWLLKWIGSAMFSDAKQAGDQFMAMLVFSGTGFILGVIWVLILRRSHLQQYVMPLVDYPVDLEKRIRAHWKDPAAYPAPTLPEVVFACACAILGGLTLFAILHYMAQLATPLG